MQKTKSLALIFGVLTMSFLVGYLVFAVWTEPASPPPDGNVPAPINIGSTQQWKEGGLGVGTKTFDLSSGQIAASIFYDKDNSSWYVNPAGTSVLSGNVGIGTTNPTRKLHIYSDVANSYPFQINASDGTILLYFYENASHYAALSLNGSGGTNILLSAYSNSWILNNYFGVGESSPGSRLAVRGGISVGETTDYSRTGAPIGGMIIKGNVGIGTTGPNYKLDVSRVGINTGAGYGADLNIGNVATNYPGNSGWAGTWNSNILLSGLDSTSISFHDSGARVDTLRVQGGTFYIGENVGWGVANLSVAGNITGPGFYYSSDESLKKNIQEIETPLAKIMKLNGISFDWKESGEKSIGLIAQDVEKVFPEIVNTDEVTGLKTIEYAKLVAPLIEAVKEQQKMIDEQKVLINQQGEEIKTLKAWVGQP